MTVEIIIKCNECGDRITDEEDVITTFPELEMERFTVRLQPILKSGKKNKNVNICSRCFFRKLRDELNLMLG